MAPYLPRDIASPLVYYLPLLLLLFLDGRTLIQYPIDIFLGQLR